MNHLTVVAKFIRIQNQIINVSDIVRVGRGDNNGHITTWMITKTPHHGDSTGTKNINYEWNGDMIDEIWDILQAGSTVHLDPHDKLREKVVL